MHTTYKALEEMRDYLDNLEIVTEWAEIENKPNQFPPSQHNHPINQVEGLQAELDSKETPQGAQNKVNAHANRTDNPHGTTKAQVGLSNVDNVKQASKQEYDQLAQTVSQNTTNISDLDQDLSEHLAEKATVDIAGHVMLNNSPTSTSVETAPTSNALAMTYDGLAGLMDGRYSPKKLDDHLIDYAQFKEKMSWEKIADITLSSNTPQIDFTSLSEYKMFKILFSTNIFGSTKGTMVIRFNTSTTGYYYNNSKLNMNELTGGARHDNGDGIYLSDAMPDGTKREASGEILIIRGRQDTIVNARYINYDNVANQRNIINFISGGGWMSNEEINTISIVSTTSNILFRSNFVLLGVK